MPGMRSQNGGVTTSSGATAGSGSTNSGEVISKNRQPLMELKESTAGRFAYGFGPSFSCKGSDLLKARPLATT